MYITMTWSARLDNHTPNFSIHMYSVQSMLLFMTTSSRGSLTPRLLSQLFWASYPGHFQNFGASHPGYFLHNCVKKTLGVAWE